MLDNLQPPACVLDMYALKRVMNPYSTTGNVCLNMCLRAVIIVEKRSLAAERQVRQLAIDVAGLVGERGRFGTKTGMSMLMGIGEVVELQNHYPHLIGWEVEWQHSVELSAPDYSEVGLRQFPEADSYYRDDSGEIQDRELSGITETIEAG